jgi:DNA-binding transcriptional LysR family regulator
MLIRHVSFFIALAREEHFARAAEACNVTQPTLTAAIQKLEEDLGVRLVIRDRRFVRLTEEGEKLLLWGRQILADYGSLKDDLAGLRRGLVGTLHLGVIPAAMSAISLLTSRFSVAHPEARVEIRSMTSRAIERALEAFEIDAGVTYLENEPLEHVRKVPLYRERYVFLSRHEHVAHASTTIAWKDAAGKRLCLLSEDMQNRRIINKVAASIGVDIKADVVCNSFLAILSHVRHGEWASIVPHTFARFFST